MKSIIFIPLLVFFCLSEDIIPPTLPEFQHANLTRRKGSYQIVTPQRTINLVNIPDVYQSTTFSCGPSSLQAVLHYHSYDFRESEVMEAAGTQRGKGTGPNMLQNGFNKLIKSTKRNLENILSFYKKENMSIQQLDQNIIKGNPVIVLIQIFKPQNDPTPYKNFNDRGHYVVIIGMDDERYYIEDPKFYNAVMYIKRSEFLDRWHDYLSTEQRMVNQVGIIVTFKDGHKPTGEQRLQYLLE